MTAAKDKPNPQLIEVGRVARPHGVNGELKVAVPTDFLEVIAALDHIFVGAAQQRYRVLGWRVHQKAWLLLLEGVSSRNDAEALRGERVRVPQNELPALDTGELYEHELIGMSVEDMTGHVLGQLSEVLVTGSNDVYVIRKPKGGELLLPAIESVIKEIDPQAGRMRVIVPDGL